MAKLIDVVATVNLAGLPAGKAARIDPDDKWMRGALKRGYLVPLDREEADEPDAG